MVLEGDRWPNPSPDTPPVVVDSAEDLFERLRSAPVRRLPSDEERYDQSFPNHPLSQVRTRLAQVEATARLDPQAGRLRPFRVRRGWRFWR
jgi:hypothetical protein